MVSTTCNPLALAAGKLLVDQCLGDHADHVAAGGTGGVGDSAHQAGSTAAVDQLAAPFANPAADGLGRGREFRSLPAPEPQ